MPPPGKPSGDDKRKFPQLFAALTGGGDTVENTGEEQDIPAEAADAIKDTLNAIAATVDLPEGGRSGRDALAEATGQAEGDEDSADNALSSASSEGGEDPFRVISEGVDFDQEITDQHGEIERDPRSLPKLINRRQLLGSLFAVGGLTLLANVGSIINSIGGGGSNSGKSSDAGFSCVNVFGDPFPEIKRDLVNNHKMSFTSGELAEIKEIPKLHEDYEDSSGDEKTALRAKLNEKYRRLGKPLQEYVITLEGEFEIDAKMDVYEDTVYRRGDPTNVVTASQMAEKMIGQDPWFKKFLLSESAQESSHTYHLLGPEIGVCSDSNVCGPATSIHANTQALSRYQIMPREWFLWCMEHLGEVVKPTPQAIEYVTFMQFYKYYKELKDIYEHSDYYLYWSMAAMWYSGEHGGQLGSDEAVPYATNLGVIKYADHVTQMMGLQPAAGERDKIINRMAQEDVIAATMQMGYDALDILKNTDNIPDSIKNAAKTVSDSIKNGTKTIEDFIGKQDWLPWK